MAFTTPTDPQAAIVEAEDKRRLARNLLAEADQLDPPKVVKKKSTKKKTAKKGKK